MTREILFRGKKYNSDLEYINFVFGYLFDYDMIKDKHGNGHVVHKETIGQFTGLTDKNGTNIFEGDILKHSRVFNSGHISTCSVVFRNGGFYLYYGNLIYEPTKDITCTHNNFEVIGNIHE